MKKSLYSPQYKTLCVLLTEAREAKAMSQAEVAAALAKPQSFVSKYEGGERRLDVIELIKICEVLELDPADLVRRVSETKQVAQKG